MFFVKYIQMCIVNSLHLPSNFIRFDKIIHNMVLSDNNSTIINKR
jgi:hypothetical protein